MKISLPKSRWKLLSQAILSNSQNSHGTISEFPDYRLIVHQELSDDEENVSWYLIEFPGLFLPKFKLGLLKKKLTLEDISGFNNTGNVRLWPSEIILAQYLLENPSMYDGKTVLELGGGMTSLAGLCIAHTLKPKSVHCTDGNIASVENIQRNILKNKPALSHMDITSGLLRWDAQEKESKKKKYDLIICSDCLFFKAGRKELADYIVNGLNSGGGRALIFAPKRNETLNDFFQLLQEFSGVEVKLIYNYSKKVTQFRIDSLTKDPHYDENIHYPYLIHCLKN